ncbi:MAG: hypothetical protein K5821_06955 [Nitrobacter sp.]|uniref:hypothetical protein n=1 Tax=Nitrobacter sp. TaxID=29420 RepID=UPI00261C9DF7|nr:hypothetical protein [Nitrobacter sp.]MCV0386157.1 hypothetical protein [Nitrobacter sp.]
MLFNQYLANMRNTRNGELVFEEAPPPEPCSDGAGGTDNPPLLPSDAEDDPSNDGRSCGNEDHPNDRHPFYPFSQLLRNIAAASEICAEAKRWSKGEFGE